MARTRRSTKSTSTLRGSPFLSLPAELRNHIYEYAARNETTIALRDGQVLYCPALSLVCWQIRKEYESIYLEVAPYRNMKTNAHITDFHRTDMSSTIRRINYFEEISSARSYAVRVFVTNSWKPRDLRQFCAGSVLNHAYERINYPFKKRLYDIEIHFDPKTFDVDACQDALLKLDSEISRGDRWWFLEDNYEDWPKVEQAFWDAFERYGAKDDDEYDKGTKPRRRCQREGEASPQAKRRRLCANENLVATSDNTRHLRSQKGFYSV